MILTDRIILKQDCDETFYKNMTERLSSGTGVMNLEDAEIVLVYCSTINKHTCIEKLHKNPNTYYLILDEHHEQMMGALNYLFYAFGTNDFKKPFWHMMMQNMSYHQKRLKNAVNLLLAEQYLLEGQVNKASYCMDEIEKRPLDTEKDFSGEMGRFEQGLFMLKSRRLDHMRSYILNFYVFHELAHIVYQEKREQMDTVISIYNQLPEDLKNQVKQLIETWKEEQIDYPYEDIICDSYALSLLFEMVYEHFKEFDYEYMVDSYICAIVNLTILDSIFRHRPGSETWYVVCWMRIVLALNTLGIYLMEKYNDAEILKAIQGRMNYCRMLFKNAKEVIVDEIYKTRATNNELKEEYKPDQKEWEETFEKVLDHIRAIK